MSSSTVRAALESYYERQQRELEGKQRPRRKRGKPELKVRSEIMTWMNSHGFDVQVVESRAVFCASANRFLKGQTTAGTSDLVGVGPDGVAVFCEVKAKNRLATLKPHQKAYLTSKIELSAFAIVADSPERVEQLWQEWKHRRAMSPQLAKAFLLRSLPTLKDEEIDDALGF